MKRSVDQGERIFWAVVFVIAGLIAVVVLLFLYRVYKESPEGIYTGGPLYGISR